VSIEALKLKLMFLKKVKKYTTKQQGKEMVLLKKKNFT